MFWGRSALFLCWIISFPFSSSFSTLAFQRTFASTSQSSNTNMGLGASLAKDEMPPPPPVPVPVPLSPVDTKEEKPSATWRSVKEKFKAELLDASYLQSSLRGNTVTASSEYPSSFPEQPGLMPGTHKHLGGAYDPTDGCVYGVPANSNSILCIYQNKESREYQMKTIPLPERIADCRYKWLRGIIAHGYLWAIPSWADAVLCVDIDAYWGRRELPEGETDVVKLIPLPKEHPKDMTWQWHGASMNKEKTAIYCVPSNAQWVLKVDVATKTTSLIEIDVDSELYPDFSLSVTNKWYGGIPGDDNAIYGIPYRACGVLRIDSITDTAKVIGPDYGVANYNWHGGVKVNGKIYAHPSHAETVLVINTNEESKGEISELPIHRASYDTDPCNRYKWLGGNVGADGNIYCPACDTSAILKINVTTDYCETMGFAGTAKNKWQVRMVGRGGRFFILSRIYLHNRLHETFF
jgi:hypothetical protein